MNGAITYVGMRVLVIVGMRVLVILGYLVGAADTEAMTVAFILRRQGRRHERRSLVTVNLLRRS